MKTKAYYENKDRFKLVLGDCIEIMNQMEENSMNMIFADVPYFLSNGGVTCSSGKMVSVNKADWDKKESIEEVHAFNREWLNACRRVLKDDGTIWISGTYHNIYSIGYALAQLDFVILNNITWQKKNPPPNLGCRCFTHSTETILWAKKSKKAKHYFDYARMKEINENKQMKDVWEMPVIGKKEKKHGAFPTQKPLKLLDRIIIAASKEGDTILDCFNGSGTTGIVAAMNNRKYIGIDINQEYLDLTIRRYEAIEVE